MPTVLRRRGQIAAAIDDIHYPGYLSAEALPLPSSQQAAEQTMATFRKYF